jgi:hypothetical protein
MAYTATRLPLLTFASRQSESFGFGQALLLFVEMSAASRYLDVV